MNYMPLTLVLFNSPKFHLQVYLWILSVRVVNSAIAALPYHQ